MYDHASQIPGMTPDIADTARDVLALVRAAGHADQEAIITVLANLNLNQTRDIVVSMSVLAAALMRQCYDETADQAMAEFARDYLSR